MPSHYLYDQLTDITIEDSRFTGSIKEAFEEYMEGRAELYTTKKKARSLMDMATLAVKELRHAGGLTNLDESDEINACTIIVPVDVNDKTEEWLLLFKNETHNHPTEIEPLWRSYLLRWLYSRPIERSRPTYTKLCASQALAIHIQD